MKKLALYFLMAAAVLLPSACRKTEPDVEPAKEKLPENYYSNLFAFNMMQTYYLWKAEVQEQMDKWTYGEDPFEKVASLRYRENGQLVDRWTLLTDDYSGLVGNVSGNTKSYGLEFVLYYTDAAHKSLCAVVTFTYAGSPARNAGLKRGDIFLTLDGQSLTQENYSSVLLSKLYNSSAVQLGMADGKTVQLTAVQMYENPVNEVLVLEDEGSKIGYLHFSSFTMDACRDLEEAFRRFKAEGIEELVLDLRYNGGGYALTSNILASMIAPPADVLAEKVFNQDIFNSLFSEGLEEEDVVSRFRKSFTFRNGDQMQTVQAAEVNPGIKKLWVIQTRSSASASESLVCGLKPYLGDNLKIVGEQSHGKFCSGYIISSSDFFNSLKAQKNNDVDCEEGIKRTENWGIYVMASRYADCHGVTLSMPFGIPVDYEIADAPDKGIALGDPEETMLAAVLSLRKGIATKSSRPARQTVPWYRPGFGMYVL